MQRPSGQELCSEWFSGSSDNRTRLCRLGEVWGGREPGIRARELGPSLALPLTGWQTLAQSEAPRYCLCLRIIARRLQGDGRPVCWGLSPLAWSQSPPQPARASGQAGTVFAGSRLPASCRQLARPPSARPALPSPPGWLRAWSRWNQRALPSFVCWCFLPFTACFLFSGLSGPGESGGPARLPAEHPWEAASQEQTSASLGPEAQHPLPPPDPRSSSLAAEPSPSMGVAAQCPWATKPPFRGSEAWGILRIH